MAVNLEAQDLRAWRRSSRSWPGSIIVRANAGNSSRPLWGRRRGRAIRGQLSLDGPPTIASVEVITKLARFGQVEFGKEALGVFLNAVIGEVGVEGQSEIRSLFDKYPLDAAVSMKAMDGSAWRGEVEGARAEIPRAHPRREYALPDPHPPAGDRGLALGQPRRGLPREPTMDRHGIPRRTRPDHDQSPRDQHGGAGPRVHPSSTSNSTRNVCPSRSPSQAPRRGGRSTRTRPWIRRRPGRRRGVRLLPAETRGEAVPSRRRGDDHRPSQRAPQADLLA